MIFPGSPRVSPTMTSNSYVRERLQVSNDGATVFGKGTRSHSLLSTLNSFVPFSSEFPKGIFRLLALIMVQLPGIVLVSSCARIFV